MSLFDTRAWAAREQEVASQGRAVLPAVLGEGGIPSARIYLFNFPIYNKVARMDRERQLFNVTMAEHIRHEQRESHWIIRSVVVVGTILVLGMLVFYPPPILENSVFYQNVSLVRQRILKTVDAVARETRAQSRIPPKVWIAGDFSLPKLLRDLRSAWEVKIDLSLWQATAARQVQEIDEAQAPKAGLALGPADGVVLVRRGEARIKGGLLLEPKAVLREGSTIVTGPKSFVKIWMSDGSMLSLGPDSELRIPHTVPREPVALEIQQGTLRAKVTKSSTLDEAGRPVEKLIIRTTTAALGIRGTDFYVALNAATGATTLVTFEGLVAFAKRDGSGEAPRTVDSATSVPVSAGTYSEVRPDRPAPTAAVSLPASRIEQLRGATDVSGPAEVDSQAESIHYIDELGRNGNLYFRQNSQAALYEPISDEDLENLAAPVARRTKLTPTKDDYEPVAEPPADLARDKKQFPGR